MPRQRPSVPCHRATAPPVPPTAKMSPSAKTRPSSTSRRDERQLCDTHTHHPYPQPHATQHAAKHFRPGVGKISSLPCVLRDNNNNNNSNNNDNNNCGAAANCLSRRWLARAVLCFSQDTHRLHQQSSGALCAGCARYNQQTAADCRSGRRASRRTIPTSEAAEGTGPRIRTGSACRPITTPPPPPAAIRLQRPSARSSIRAPEIAVGQPPSPSGRRVPAPKRRTRAARLRDPLGRFGAYPAGAALAAIAAIAALPAIAEPAPGWIRIAAWARESSLVCRRVRPQHTEGITGAGEVTIRSGPAQCWRPSRTVISETATETEGGGGPA